MKNLDSAEDYDDSDQWKAADHVNRVHILVAAGTVIEEIETSYGIAKNVPEVDHIFVRADDEWLHFERTRIFQAAIAAPLREEGVMVGRLIRPERAYLWEPVKERTLEACEKFLTTQDLTDKGETKSNRSEDEPF